MKISKLCAEALYRKVKNVEEALVFRTLIL